MNLEELMLHSEAIIFAADRPVNQNDIETVLRESHELEEDSLEKLPSALDAIIDKYTSNFYPFEVKKSGGGYQFLSKSTFHPMIAKLNGTKFRKRLSVAAMETLAIIAYRQPTTKSEIEYIRGVNSDYSVQKLLDLELIVINGRKEEAVGKPLVYGTSNSLLDYLGIDTLEDLPKLNEISTYEDIIPTDALEAMPNEGESQWVVDANGEIKEEESQTAEDIASNEVDQIESNHKEESPEDESADTNDTAEDEEEA